MSETVHHRGTITEVEPPKGITLEDYAKQLLTERGKTIRSYHKNGIDALCDTFYGEFFSYKETLYSIDDKDLDPDGTIIRAKVLSPKVIEYELRFYNGGASFQECLEEALDTLKPSRPDHILGWKIDWNAKTVSVPEYMQDYGGYKLIVKEAKELGLNIQLAAL
jgi:hypothetical protein